MYKNVCKEVIACEFCSVDLAAKNGILKVDKEGYHRDAYKQGKAAKHICFSRQCFTCGEKYDRLQTENHRCAVKKLTTVDKLKEDKKPYGIITVILKHELTKTRTEMTCLLSTWQY